MKAKNLKFLNCNGNRLFLSPKATIKQLVQMGIEVRLEPKERPKPTDPRIYIHTP